MKNPLLSVIIPVWNGREHLVSCLAALEAQTYAPLEIIAVDNASQDGSAELLATTYPTVKLIRNSQNLGFAGGCNTGLRAAQGEVLILLNQDTEVEPDWAQALANLFQSEGLPSAPIGIAGCKAFYPDGSLQHAGGYVDQQGGGHHYREEQAGESGLREVDFVTGAALAISRPAYEQIGELDEGFFPAYYEDVDWCYRARLAAFRVVYLPSARLIHKEISHLADGSHQDMYLHHRHRLRFVFKHWPIIQLKDDFLPTEQAWLRGLAPGGERLVAAMYRAYLFHLLHLDDLLSWRQKLLGSALDEADGLAQILTTLRSVVPLAPARIGIPLEVDKLEEPVEEEEPVDKLEEPAPEELAEEAEPKQNFVQEDEISASSTTEQEQEQEQEQEKSRVDRLLAQLNERWWLREHQFDSPVPRVGRLITTVRNLWYSVAAKWSIRELIRQQNEVNALVLELLAHLQNQQTHFQNQQTHLQNQQALLQNQQTNLQNQQTNLQSQQADLQNGLTQVHLALNRFGELHGALSRRVDGVSNQLSQESYDRERLAEVLAEYLSENGRTLAEIAYRLQSLTAPSEQSAK